MESLFRDIVHFFQASYDALYVFTFIVATFLLVSGLDDVGADLYYWFYYTFRRKRLNRFQLLPTSTLHGTPEKPIAIFIPTWHEFDVIEQMLTRACTTIDYKSYDIFVGVYPNDPATTVRVESVARVFSQVHPVVATHPGPSTKAENLNDIHQGMIRWENQTGIRYDVIVLHDAEDVIHPLSLKTFNCFVPEYDMVQLPVYPFVTPQKKIVHWTYCDEFAENHTKDLMARQEFSGFTPSAGVGTAYNRWLMEFVGTSFARNMFSKSSLTEDYDIALRLALGKANLLYLYRPFGLNIATWAYFPQTFTTAVRQRTRWLIGICIQSWRNYGWVGDLKFRLTLYRDRKAVISNNINALAYVVLIYVLLYELAEWGLRDYGTLIPIVSKGTLLWDIVLIDTVLMLWRFIHRFVSVSRIYGRKAGALSIPRLPVGNIVNFTATVRAFKQYFVARRKKKKVTWEKTAHKFPTAEESTTIMR
jgi:adsorption protein B